MFVPKLSTSWWKSWSDLFFTWIWHRHKYHMWRPNMVGNYLINSHIFMWDQQPLDNRKYFANSVCIMRLISILSSSEWLSIVHHFTGAPIFSRTMLNVRLFAKTWMHFGPESANQKFWVEMGNYRISGIKIRIIISLFYPKISKHFLKPMSDILIYLPR